MQNNRYTMLTQLLHNLYNHYDIKCILKDLYLKYSSYSYTHKSQENLQLIENWMQNNRYTMLTQLLHNLYNHYDIKCILKDLYLKYSSYSYTHKSQENLQLIENWMQNNQYTMLTQLLYNLYNHYDIECILKDLYLKNSSQSYTRMSQENLQLIENWMQNNQYTMLTQLLYNLYNHYDIECILKDLYLKNSSQSYTRMSLVKLQLIENWMQNNQYTMLTQLLYNLYNHYDIECILKDLYLKYSSQSYTRMSLVMYRLKRHQSLNTLNTKKTLLLYNLYNHYDIECILKGLFQIYNILNCISIRQEKLQLKKQRQDCMSSNPIWFLRYKYRSHHGIQNTLKGRYYLHTTHLHKNKTQEKIITQYYLLHSSSNPNQYLHYKQYNHCDIQNILKDWYYFHNNHLYKNNLQEKTEYQQLRNRSNPNQYLQHKQYSHRGIQNILKD